MKENFKELRKKIAGMVWSAYNERVMSLYERERERESTCTHESVHTTQSDRTNTRNFHIRQPRSEGHYSLFIMPAQLPIITKYFVQYSRTNFSIKSRHATKESYFN